jgi:hypothetical protein
MTGAERSWASRYEINDVVRYARGSKAIGIEAAAYASVIAINPSANQLTVQKADAELATYVPRRLAGVSVYQEIRREFSVGDRVQFTAPDKSHGVANRDMAAIEAIHPDGRLSVRLDNNRQIEFNPNEHRHLDHGYAVKSQLPGPHRRTRACSRRYQRPPGFTQLPLRLRLDLPRQPPGHAFSPTTSQSSPPSSERTSQEPPPWKSIKPHPSPREWE